MLVVPALSHTEMWAWQPLPVRPGKGFGMNVARSPCFSATDLRHELEERVPVGRDERVVEVPVHFELAVGVLVVVLVGAPAQLQHVVADFGDHVVAAHQGLLVVARLGRLVGGVRDGGAVGRGQEEFALDAGLDVEA